MSARHEIKEISASSKLMQPTQSSIAKMRDKSKSAERITHDDSHTTDGYVSSRAGPDKPQVIARPRKSLGRT